MPTTPSLTSFASLSLCRQIISAASNHPLFKELSQSRVPDAAKSPAEQSDGVTQPNAAPEGQKADAAPQATTDAAPGPAAAEAAPEQQQPCDAPPQVAAPRVSSNGGRPLPASSPTCADAAGAPMQQHPPGVAGGTTPASNALRPLPPQQQLQAPWSGAAATSSGRPAAVRLTSGMYKIPGRGRGDARSNRTGVAARDNANLHPPVLCFVCPTFVPILHHQAAVPIRQQGSQSLAAAAVTTSGNSPSSRSEPTRAAAACT